MNDKSKKIILVLLVVAILIITGASTYAFFQYTRIGGTNLISTSQVVFEFTDSAAISLGNVAPIEQEDIDNVLESNFTITAHNSLSDGVRYKVYAVYGDNEQNKTRLVDNVMSLEFTPAADANGFTNMINNYATAKSPVFVDGQALISTGIIKDTTASTVKSYNVKLWIDSSKILVSSTTKRANNNEGHPSLADTTGGEVTIDRYIKNDNNLISTTIFPAESVDANKIVYTTKEFSNSYYSIKIVVEAEEVKEDEYLVYFDTNGGTLSTETKMVTVGSTYGTLPEPHRDGYTFLGWNGKNLLNLEVDESVPSNTTMVNTTLRLYQKNTFIKGLAFDNYYNPIALLSYSLLNNEIDEVAISGYGLAFPLSCKSNTSYMLTLNISVDNVNLSSENYPYVSVSYYDANGNYISYRRRDGIGNINMQFTTPNNLEYLVVLFGAKSNDSHAIFGAIQLEEGSVATEYEPYYVTSSVNVTQEKDHVLKAIWQKNNS